MTKSLWRLSGEVSKYVQVKLLLKIKFDIDKCPDKRFLNGDIRAPELMFYRLW